MEERLARKIKGPGNRGAILDHQKPNCGAVGTINVEFLFLTIDVGLEICGSPLRNPASVRETPDDRERATCRIDVCGDHFRWENAPPPQASDLGRYSIARWLCRQHYLDEVFSRRFDTRL